MLPSLMQENENYGIFQIFNAITQNDGYGGYVTTYEPGATFDAVLVLDDSLQAQVAEKQGVTGVYTLTYEKVLHLPWHTAFKKISGEKLVGTYFRVTSKDENATPGTSSLNLRYVKCEEFVPSGGV